MGKYLQNFGTKFGILFVFIYFIISLELAKADKMSKKHGCVKLLSNLSLADQHFTQCALINSVPVTICSTCKGTYDAFVESYTTLSNAFDPDLNQSCKELYFNQDRLNAVEYIFHSVNNLWEKGFCGECYDGQSIGNDTEDLLSKIESVNLCIHGNKNEKKACTMCVGQYQLSNSLYEEFITNHKNKVCFDIQDAMNRTRYLWSHQLGCYRRTADLTAFLAVSSILCLLPALFYGGFIFYTRHSERNNTAVTILNNEPQEQESPAINSVIPTLFNSADILRNSTSKEKVDLKDPKVYDDSDEDPIYT